MRKNSICFDQIQLCSGRCVPMITNHMTTCRMITTMYKLKINHGFSFSLPCRLPVCLFCQLQPTAKWKIFQPNYCSLRSQFHSNNFPYAQARNEIDQTSDFVNWLRNLFFSQCLFLSVINLQFRSFIVAYHSAECSAIFTSFLDINAA